MSSRAKQVALVIEGARLRRLQALVGSVLLLGALLSAQQALVPASQFARYGAEQAQVAAIGRALDQWYVDDTREGRAKMTRGIHSRASEWSTEQNIQRYSRADRETRHAPASFIHTRAMHHEQIAA